MAGRMEVYPEDQVIIREGQKNDKMYVVLEGSVVLYMNYGKENEYVLGVCGKDKVFGEMSMLADEESTYTAVAFTEVKVAWFQEGNLNTFLQGYPDSAVNFLKNIAKNNALMRKNLVLFMNEVDEMNAKLQQKEAVKNDAAKLSVPSLYAIDETKKGKYHFIGRR